MDKWLGSAGICINERSEILMVLQGKPEEPKKWSVPSGGQESNETFEQCCIREFREETGYLVEVVSKIKVKKVTYKEHNLSAEIHYFKVNIVGGKKAIQDPDHLIYDIDWKSSDEIKALLLSFPEDENFLLDLLNEDL